MSKGVWWCGDDADHHRHSNKQYVTEAHDGTYRVVIASRPSAPQHIPTDGGLACSKSAVWRDETDGSAAARLVGH